MMDNRKQTFSIIVGIAMGIAIQFFMINLLPSLQGYMMERILGNSYHIKIEQGETKPLLFKEFQNENTLFIDGNSEISRNRITDYPATIKSIRELDEVRNVAGYLSESALFSKNGKSNSVLLLGSDFDSINSIYNLTGKIVSGKAQIDSNNIVVGIDFAKDNNLKLEDLIQLQLSNGKSETFRIVGIFDFGNVINNRSWIFMDLNRAQSIFDKKGFISTIDVQLADPFQGDNIRDFLKERFKDLKISSWTSDMPDLLVALKSQTITSLIIQIFITVATAMSISSILGITVLQKSKQLGILKTLGLSNSSAMKIFLYEGLLFGIFSTFVGILVGSSIIIIFEKFSPLAFPIEIRASYSIIITIVSIGSAVLASMIPALKSKKLNPIDIIRGN